MSLLSVDRLSVAYEDSAKQPVQALQDVSLDIDAGELVVALGASGCGKTTLLNVMAGFLSPDAGQARFRGKAITGPDADRGVVFQNDALFPWLDVRGNVEFPLRLKDWPKWQRSARVDSCFTWSASRRSRINRSGRFPAACSSVSAWHAPSPTIPKSC